MRRLRKHEPYPNKPRLVVAVTPSLWHSRRFGTRVQCGGKVEIVPQRPILLPEQLHGL